MMRIISIAPDFEYKGDGYSLEVEYVDCCGEDWGFMYVTRREIEELRDNLNKLLELKAE